MPRPSGWCVITWVWPNEPDLGIGAAAMKADMEAVVRPQRDRIPHDCPLIVLHDAVTARQYPVRIEVGEAALQP